MNKSARWQRAMIAGGTRLDPERWNKIVAQAADSTRRRFSASSFPETVDYKPRRVEALWSGDVVLRAVDILAIEMALAESEQLVDEIHALADEDLDTSRGAHLRSTIERARAAVEYALKQRGDT